MNASELQSMLTKQVGRGGVHNIVLAAQSKDGRIDLSAAAGTADAASGAPMQTGTPYLLASIAKMYTAAVILKLHETGAISLDAPVADYLPADLIAGIHTHKGTDYTGAIKVHHLLAQTSGLADYYEGKGPDGRSLVDDIKVNRDRALSLPDMLAMARDMSPHHAPGEKAHYSDTNYQLLGAIIAAATGKPVVTVFDEMIFSPLGLKHTYAYEAPPENVPPPADMYFKDTVIRIPKLLASFTPDGGLVSTAGESITFLRAFFEGRLFDAALFERMTRQWNGIFFPLQYGYGMMRFKLPRIFSPFKPLPEFIGHSGSTGSLAFYCPDRELYLAGTVNQMAAPRKPFQLMTQAINALKA